MPKQFQLTRCAPLCAVLSLAAPIPAYAQQQAESAGLDFFLGAAFRNILTFPQSEVSTEEVRGQIALNFFALMSNADIVLSHADSVDYLRVVSNKYSFSVTKEPARYDPDRDGVVTQSELEVFWSKDAWKSAAHEYKQGATFEAATERFKDKLGQQTAFIRDLMGGRRPEKS